MSDKEKRKLNIFKVVNKKNVMSSVSAVTLLILIITASVAWFVLQRTATIRDIGSKISEWDFIVSTESMGRPLETDEAIDILADSIKTNEIGSGKLAPGSYGNIDLYVRTSTDVASDFYLTIDKANLKINVDDVTDISYTTEELTQLLHSHIKFYADETYTQEVSLTEPITGELALGEEKKVTIYWVWHYDGTFLCDDTMTDEEKAQIMNQYDEEDVVISEYKEYIEGSIRIAVAGTQLQPQPQP
jgi:hypothetical protein